MHRGNRFCLRIGRDICWHCCNEKRVDMSCSDSCHYAMKQIKRKTEQIFQYQTNADSGYEFMDLVEQEMKYWSRKPQEVFGGKIPLKMSVSKEGREEIEKLFNALPLSNRTPLIYLKEILELENLKVDPPKESVEEFAMKFLDKIIEQDWEGTISYLYDNKRYEDRKFRENYLNRLKSNKIIQKMTTYDLISSAQTKDRKQFLVHFEINRKYDLTLHLLFENGKWKIHKKIMGKLEIYNGEKEAYEQVAVLLSKNELGNAYELLQKYSQIYLDSADFKYYWGLYYSFLKNNEKAKNFFFDALELDPEFTEAKYNYALMLHAEKKIEETKKQYHEILEHDPEEPKTLNNLASILIDEKNFEEAKKLLEKCLKVAPEFEIAKKNLERIDH